MRIYLYQGHILSLPCPPGSLLDGGYKRDLLLKGLELLVPGDRKLSRASLRPKGNGAHRPRKTRVMVPSRQLRSGPRGQYRDHPYLLPLPAQPDSLLLHVWFPRTNCSPLTRTRRLAKHSAHSGKAKVPVDLSGYDWVTCPSQTSQ